ncbi:hypothetical protein JY477_00560 [Serratia marcescens]|nr:hypothetical protein [Serratia marcescens]
MEHLQILGSFMDTTGQRWAFDKEAIHAIDSADGEEMLLYREHSFEAPTTELCAQLIHVEVEPATAENFVDGSAMFNMRSQEVNGKPNGRIIADFQCRDQCDCEIEFGKDSETFCLTFFSDDGSIYLERDAAIAYAKKILAMAGADSNAQ